MIHIARLKKPDRTWNINSLASVSVGFDFLSLFPYPPADLYFTNNIYSTSDTLLFPLCFSQLGYVEKLS